MRRRRVLIHVHLWPARSLQLIARADPLPEASGLDASTSSPETRRISKFAFSASREGHHLSATKPPVSLASLAELAAGQIDPKGDDL